MKSSLIVSMSCLALFACDKGPKLAETCQQHPQICAEFTEDSWCKRERKQTIFSGAALASQKTELHQFNLLIALEGYSQCLSLASKIEHIKLKEKTTRRIDNYVKVLNKIDDLSLQTANGEHPYLLYYHWSHHLDENALAKFLKLEGSALLETPASQLNLATYYTKRDPKKTLSLLFHALELTQSGERVNPETFKSLATIFTYQKKYKQAYIWIKVLDLYAPEEAELSQQTLDNYQRTFALNGDLLDKVATSTLEKIDQGKFIAPRF
jgi:hypothetical protein